MLTTVFLDIFKSIVYLISRPHSASAEYKIRIQESLSWVSSAGTGPYILLMHLKPSLPSFSQGDGLLLVVTSK